MSSGSWDPQLKIVAATADLQAAASKLLAAENVRAVWPLIQINTWGREQLRILALTGTNLYRMEMSGGSPKISECTPISTLRFVVKGFLCYRSGTIVNAMAGEKQQRIYGMQIYSSGGTEPYRTFRALDLVDELGMRSFILHIVDVLSAAARELDVQQFFIADYDIVLSAKLGPLALLGNAMKPPSLIATSEAAAVRLARVNEKERRSKDLDSELSPETSSV